MGYIAHHAIVVTGYESYRDDALTIEDARRAALKAGCRGVTPVVGPAVNGTWSFLVAPDGSKEGWTNSDEGDEARARFISWLLDASARGRFDWVEVRYSPDDADAKVTRHRWPSD